MSTTLRPSARGRLLLAGAIAVMLAAGTRLAGAADPPESLRLTRLAQSEPGVAFSVATPDGGMLRLADLKGKVVLLNFWATWCEPCLEEMPAMERLSRAYRDRGLVVLALSADREGASVVKPFLKRHGLSFSVGWTQTSPWHASTGSGRCPPPTSWTARAPASFRRTGHATGMARRPSPSSMSS
jgi:thiol-disulfide isomerase/thioredoxin